MKDTFRQSMRWLHTAIGLALGWVIYLIFFNGTIAFYREELTTWMKPEIPYGIDVSKSVTAADLYLRQHAGDARHWRISIPDARTPVARASWGNEREGRRSNSDLHVLFDARGHILTARDTKGGDYFLQFHLALYYLPPFLGFFLVTLAGVALMSALATGIIIHRRIFIDMFTFRTGGGAASWRGVHTLMAVLPLPFHFMITYTGVAIGVTFLMPWGAVANYKHPERWLYDLRPASAVTPLVKQAAPLVPIEPLLAKAQALWKGDNATSIQVDAPNDQSSIVTITRAAYGPLNNGIGSTLVFNGVSGALKSRSPRLSPSAQVAGAVFSLHQGQFASPVLRALLALSGVMGTVMCASGLLLWTSKKRRQAIDGQQGRGLRFVDSLNVAVLAGYPVACGAYFLANRLLPVTLGGRADTETAVLFCTWGILSLWAIARPASRRLLEICLIGAFCFTALPILNAFTTTRGSVGALLGGDTLYLAVDWVLLLCAGVFTALATSAMRRNRVRPTGIKTKKQISSARRRGAEP